MVAVHDWYGNRDALNRRIETPKRPLQIALSFLDLVIQIDKEELDGNSKTNWDISPFDQQYRRGRFSTCCSCWCDHPWIA